MLKAGRIVALDTTQNLLSRFAGHHVPRGRGAHAGGLAAPASAAATATSTTSRSTSYAELESLLAALREDAIAIDELALEEADLEQVFLRIMKNPEAAAMTLRCDVRITSTRGARELRAGTQPRPAISCGLVVQGAATRHRARVAGHGWVTLLYKELLRFWKVSFQTIAAPMLTALLYLLIFSHVLEGRVSVYDGRVTYTAFLVPGLVMMSVLQNAFANSSSSLIQSKITGNLIFVLLPPLSAGDLFAAYVLGAMVRGLVVGGGVFVVTLLFAPSLLLMPHPLWALAFALPAARSSACSACSPACGPRSSTSSRRSRTSSSCR